MDEDSRDETRERKVYMGRREGETRHGFIELLAVDDQRYRCRKILVVVPGDNVGI